MKKFPGGPVVRTGHFHFSGPGSIPGQRTKIPQNMLWGQKTQETKKLNNKKINNPIKNG